MRINIRAGKDGGIVVTLRSENDSEKSNLLQLKRDEIGLWSEGRNRLTINQLTSDIYDHLLEANITSLPPFIEIERRAAAEGGEYESKLAERCQMLGMIARDEDQTDETYDRVYETVTEIAYEKAQDAFNGLDDDSKPQALRDIQNYYHDDVASDSGEDETDTFYEIIESTVQTVQVAMSKRERELTQTMMRLDGSGDIPPQVASFMAGMTNGLKAAFMKVANEHNSSLRPGIGGL